MTLSETLTVNIQRKDIYALMKVTPIPTEMWDDLLQQFLGQMCGTRANRKIRWRFGNLDRLTIEKVWELYERCRQ